MTVLRSIPRDRPPVSAVWRQLVALLTLCGIVVSGLTGAAGTAAADPEDRLEDRRNTIADRLHEARGDLGHSSRQLRQAVAAVERATARLTEARAQLAATSVQLDQAIAYDLAMQRQPSAAVERLARACASRSTAADSWRCIARS
ncbi:MAG: hypothetical protein M3P83_02985 [Actinomycetota bacterium]|nr:hypothetical protein [Actinomycetota bacterium]